MIDEPLPLAYDDGRCSAHVEHAVDEVIVTITNASPRPFDRMVGGLAGVAVLPMVPFMIIRAIASPDMLAIAVWALVIVPGTIGGLWFAAAFFRPRGDITVVCTIRSRAPTPSLFWRIGNAERWLPLAGLREIVADTDLFLRRPDQAQVTFRLTNAQQHQQFEASIINPFSNYGFGKGDAPTFGQVDNALPVLMPKGVAEQVARALQAALEQYRTGRAALG